MGLLDKKIAENKIFEKEHPEEAKQRKEAFERQKQLEAQQREEAKLRQEYPRVERRIKVVDDWYPNYPDGTIKATILISIDIDYFQNKRKPEHSKYYIKFVFWGYDDYGLEKEFESDDFEKILVKRDEWIEYLNKVPENIDLREYLSKDGFIPG